MKLKNGLLLLALFFTFFACLNKDFGYLKNESTAKSSAKQWFKKNGGKYREGSMLIQGPKGVFKVQLDWSKAKSIIWRNKSFLDVPYYLENGNRYVPGADGTGAASFNLVIHLYKNGDYRGAIRTTSYDGLTYETSNKVVQFYEMLDGRPMNVWYKDARRKRIVSATQINITKDEFQLIKQTMSDRLLSSTKPGNSRTNSLTGSADASMGLQSATGTDSRTYDSANCTITETTIYYDCSGSGNPGSAGEGEYADPVVVAVCPFVTHTIVCAGDTPGNTDGGGPAGDGGAGSGSGSNGDNDEGPGDCNDDAPPPPPPPPPVNPDGTTTPPYDPPLPCELFPPEQPPEPDPCATAKAIAANTKFQSKLNDLTLKVSTSSVEHAYLNTLNADGTYSYKPYDASPSTPAEIPINVSSLVSVSDMMHNHYSTPPGLFSTFDGSDINIMYQLYNEGKMASINTFTSTVVTSAGTYMLAINDPSAFKELAKNASDNLIDMTLQIFGFKNTNSINDNEKALVTTLGQLKSGLTLLKQNPNGSFAKLSIDSNGNIIVINCN